MVIHVQTNCCSFTSLIFPGRALLPFHLNPLSAPHRDSPVTEMETTTLLILGLITIGLRNPEIRMMIASWLQSPPVEASRVDTAAEATPAAAFSHPGGATYRHKHARTARTNKTGWRKTGPHYNNKSKINPGARVTSSFHTNSHAHHNPPTQPFCPMTRSQCPNCDRVTWLDHVNNMSN